MQILSTKSWPSPIQFVCSNVSLMIRGSDRSILYWVSLPVYVYG